MKKSILSLFLVFPLFVDAQTTSCLPPTISSSDKYVGIGQTVNLNAQGCSGGFVLWYDKEPTQSVTPVEMGSVVSFQIPKVTTNTITYYATCQVGSCNSQASSYTFNLKRKSINSSNNLALSLAVDENSTFEQQLNYVKNIIPPSPNASSLGEYANFPVNLYTGVLPITIPLYTLAGRGINIPITLSYQTKGHKVGETSSSVGLGFALDAGGIITRSVRGLPDEETGGYLETRSNYPNPTNLNILPSGGDDNMRIEAANGLRDYSPDLFMFNALGRSYRLLFSVDALGNPKIITQPYSDIKISVNFSTKTWTVILEDGTKMIFGTNDNFVEYIFGAYLGEPASDIWQFITSWYLQSVISPVGETINFTYSGSSIWQDASYVEIDYERQSLSYPSRIAHKKVRSHNVTALSLSSIESELGRIDFLTDARLDLIGGKRFTGFKVFDKLSNTYIKQIVFNQSYANAVLGGAYNVPYAGTSDLYRLRLNSLEESSIDGSQKKTWQFEYNPLNLPSRHSYAQDHYGFYNGATSNTTLLPPLPHFSNNPSGNRSPNGTYMEAEMLTKIIYPTGGYSTFAYEPNIDVNGALVGGLRIKSIVDFDNVDVTNNQTRSFVYEEPYVIASFDPSTDYETTLTVKTHNSLCATENTYQYYVRNIFTKSALGSIQGGTIGYGKVTTIYGANGEKGRTISYFRNDNDWNTSEAKYPPYPPVTSLDWRRGLLTQQTDYTSSNYMVKDVQNPSYSFDNKGTLSTWALMMNTEHQGCYSYTSLASILWMQSYSLITEQVKKNKTEVYEFADYTNTNPKLTTTDYYYDNSQHTQVTRTVSTRSNGKKITNLTNYPLDYAVGTGFIDNLVANNMLSFPVENVVYQENNDGSNKEILSGAIIQYQANSTGLKDKVLVLETQNTIPLTSFKFSNTTVGNLPFSSSRSSFSADAKYQSKISFDLYDSKKNLVQYHLDDEQVNNTLLYGYRGNYVVSELKNVSYNQAKSYLGISGEIDLGDGGLNSSQESALRDNLNTSFVRSFVHRSLVGLQKSTAPNNLSINYVYDGLLRLKTIANHSGNLTDRFTYQYSTNTGGCTPPSAPSINVTNSTLCNTTLSASSCGGTVNWSNGMSGSSITVNTNNSIIYTATCHVSGCSSTTSNSLSIPVLSSNWQSMDIGNPNAGCTEAGSGTGSGALTMVGNGSVGGYNDNFHYVYKPFSGDFTLIAKISSLTNTDGLRGGIMIRSNLNTDAQFYTLIQDGNANVGELKRDVNGGYGGLYSFAPAPLNQTWIKVIKTGSSIKGYYSSDVNPEVNNAWNDYFNLTQNNPTILDFGSTYYLGLVSWGNNNLMTFSNITINGQPF